MTTCVDVLLGLRINPVENHLNSLVQVEAGVQLPPFCLVTQDLPSMSLERLKVVAGSAGPSSIGKPSARSGTKPLPIPAGGLKEKRLKEIKEGILQHNQECRDVQERLNRERQRLHRVAVRYGLSTNLWTAIILMIPILLHETEQVSRFLVYDCSHDQLKTQTINLTAPKDCRDPTTNYHPARTTEIRVILTDGDMPVITTQCLVLKTQEVTRCGGHPSFHYGLFKVPINQPVVVTPQECRDALIADKISVQGQRMDLKIGVSHYHQYYSEGGRTAIGDCVITTFTRKGVTYQKSYEETTIRVLITKVRGLKLDNTIRFPSGLVAPHAHRVVRDIHNGMLVWDTKVQHCQDHMSLMYQGRAKLHQARSTSNAQVDLEEAIILVAQNETKRYAEPRLGGHQEHVWARLQQHPDSICGCLYGHRRPQQGLEVPEVYRPRRGQPPHAHALLTPQLRVREFPAIRGIPRSRLPGRAEGSVQQTLGIGIRQQVGLARHLRSRIPYLLVGVSSLRCPMSPSGGQNLRPGELHAADPSRNRIRGIWECDSEIRQRPDDDPPGYLVPRNIHRNGK
jgi:hypothetical protein